MSGILFLKTKEPDKLKDFYLQRLNCQIWMEQAHCRIYRHGNFLFGFCERDEVDTSGMLTFFYESRKEVDRMYELLKSIAVEPPGFNSKYNIYQFFAHDPEGRMLEFQYFEDPVAQFLTGDDLLLSRRSVRQFTSDEIADDLLKTLVNNCRFAPTSRNTQGFYFKIVRDKTRMDWLANVRGKSSAPIGRAPLAVAIAADPAVTKRPDQDACIATCHFILAAWFYGLGTCWIGGMDREDVKEQLGIPADHYLATVTPLGYPEQRVIEAPPRKALDEFMRD